MADSLIFEAAQNWSNDFASRCGLPFSDYYHQAQQFTLPNVYPAVLPTMSTNPASPNYYNSSRSAVHYAAPQRYQPHHQENIQLSTQSGLQCYSNQFLENGDVYVSNTTVAQMTAPQTRRVQRYPFERTVSSPEFHPFQQYFPDLTNLHAGQSQSMPTFENSVSDFDQTLPNYTPSPENLSTGSRSPTYYGGNNSSFAFYW